MADPPPPPTDVHGIARASYDRCGAAPDFFLCFYRNFFKRCPEAEPLFAETDFQRQHRLLRHGIGLLLAFPLDETEGKLLLRRIADRHGKGDLRIDPGLYPAWVDSLIDTVAEHDAEFTPEVEAAWRVAIAPGVAYMQERA